MRTTIELSNTLRTRLLEVAARRGERGFSTVVEEAVGRYLEAEDRRRRHAEEARAVIGTLSEKDARDLEDSVRLLRGTWR